MSRQIGNEDSVCVRFRSAQLVIEVNYREDKA
jgi:hypothetical protein